MTAVDSEAVSEYRKGGSREKVKGRGVRENGGMLGELG